MRESIGTTFMLNFIILFLFLVFAFLAGTFSYYKAYKVNNFIASAIEKYEGYNTFSKPEIRARLASLGYDTSVQTSCPKQWKGDSSSRRVHPDPGNPYDDAENGICIYYYEKDVAGTTNEKYYSYGIVTYIQFQFPGFGYLIKIPIFSRTNRMYDFG